MAADAAKNQPLSSSPSLVSNVTGSTPVRPISPGAGTPPVGKYINRRCIVQMSARTAATMTTTYPAAMIIGRLISMTAQYCRWRDSSASVGSFVQLLVRRPPSRSNVASVGWSRLSPRRRAPNRPGAAVALVYSRREDAATSRLRTDLRLPAADADDADAEHPSHARQRHRRARLPDHHSRRCR